MEAGATKRAGAQFQRRGLRLAAPLAAAALLLLLVVYQGHSSAWRHPALQMSQVAVAEVEVEVLEEQGPLQLTTVASWPNSTCGASATARGPHQRVASFSFYGNVNHTRGYFKGIERNAAAIGRLYPGWTMRLYHDVPPTSGSAASSDLERLSRDFPHLDLCYVGDVPGYGDMRGSQQNAWRFLAMADPLVDVFISRDLDALPLEREAEAVGEWLESNATFHLMRDHTKHITPILAGMWGARPHLKREALRALAEAITGQPKGKKGEDQRLLAKHVWPAIRGRGVLLASLAGEGGAVPGEGGEAARTHDGSGGGGGGRRDAAGALPAVRPRSAAGTAIPVAQPPALVHTVVLLVVAATMRRALGSIFCS